MWVCNPVRVNNSKEELLSNPRKKGCHWCSELVLNSHLLPIQEAKRPYKPELMLVVIFTTPSLKATLPKYT